MSSVVRRAVSGTSRDISWHRSASYTFPQDDDEWIEVLRRPPETWSAAEVAHWAQRPRDECGGQLGDWLAQRLWENAIDGRLLLFYGSSGPSGGGAGAGTGVGGVDPDLLQALGALAAAQRQALAEAIEQLRTLHDRILYGDIVLSPPPELLEHSAAAAAAAVAAHRLSKGQPRARPQTARRRPSGVVGGGIAGALPGFQAGPRMPQRPVGLSAKERILLDAKQKADVMGNVPGRSANAEAAATKTGSAGGEGGRTDPPAGSGAGAGSGRADRRSGSRAEPAGAGTGTGSDDAELTLGQWAARGRLGATYRGEDRAGASVGEKGHGEAGEKAEQESGAAAGRRVMGEMRRMAELVAAHEEAARRLRILQLEGPGGLSRFEAQRRRAAEAEAEREARAAADAQAAEAAAAVPPPPLVFEEVEERGRLVRQQVASQAAEIDELAKVPLRRAMRASAARAEAQVAAVWGDHAEAANAAGGATWASGGTGFAGSGAERVLRSGWREVNDDGSDGGGHSVRQSLSTAGRELLVEADRKEAEQARDPWVYDNEEEEDDEDEAGYGSGRDASGRSRGRPVGRGAGGRGRDEKEEERHRRRRPVQQQVRDQPWAVPDLRSDDSGAEYDGREYRAGAVAGARQPLRRRPQSAAGGRAAAAGQHHRHSDGPPGRAGAAPGGALRPGGPIVQTGGGGTSGAGRTAAAGRIGGGGGGGPMHALVGLPRGRGREPGSWEVHPPHPRLDPWLTADEGNVRRVLTRGASTPVHHTLKTKLAEDVVRHMYGMQPAATSSSQAATGAGGRGRGKAAEPGPIAAAVAAAAVPFFPPSSLLANYRAAAHEVNLRREMGMAVPLDLLAARSVAVPRAAGREAQEEQGAPRESDAVVTQPEEPGDVSVGFASRYGFSIVPSPNASSHAAAPNPDQPAAPASAAAAPAAPRPRSAARAPRTVTFAEPPSPAQAAGPSAVPHRTAAPKRTSVYDAPISRIDDVVVGAFPLASSGPGDPPGKDLAEGDPSAGRTQTHGSPPPPAVASMPRSRLAPPELRVLGIGTDGELRRAIAANVAAAGEAAVAAGPGAGDAAKGPVRRSTSSARVRGVLRVGTFLQGEWGDPDLNRSMHETLALLDGGIGPGSHGGGPTQIHRFKDGELVYTGRRPPFSAVPEPQYQLPGWHPRPMGQSFTKLDAERLAGCVSADVRGNTELHWAASRGDAGRVAELLAEAGDPERRAALVSARNQSGETPLHRAATCRGTSAVAALDCLLAVAGPDTDPRDVNGVTPLMAVITGECWLPEGDKRVRRLLAAGASVAVCDVAGETLLHKAIIHNVCRGAQQHHHHHHTGVRNHLRRQQQQHAADSAGDSCPSGLSNLLQLLLTVARQPPAYLPDTTASTSSTTPSRLRPRATLAAAPAAAPTPPASAPAAHPLAAAAAAGTAGVFIATAVAAAAVAAAGGSAAATPPDPAPRLHIDSRDAQGRTALHLACAQPHLHGPGMEGCCVTALLRSGADPNAVDGAGRRPLHWVLSDAAVAARMRDANRINHAKLATSRPKQSPGALCWLVEQLLRAGADPSAPDEATGHTPLHLAALARSAPLLRLLLRLGADPRVADKGGRTAGAVLRSALGSTNDREETTRLESLVELVAKYERTAEKAAVAAAAAAAAAGARGRRSAQSDQTKPQRGARPGLGGGKGPKSLRQLYLERYGDSEIEEEEELPPTQAELAQAYMAAMRAGRPGTETPGPSGPVGGFGGGGGVEDPGSGGVASFSGAPAVRLPPAPPMDSELAATKIQAAFRGHRTRQRLQSEGMPVRPVRRTMADRGTHRTAAAAFTPNAVPYGPEHERAAVKIQAAYRGRLARKQNTRRRAGHHEEETQAGAGTGTSAARDVRGARTGQGQGVTPAAARVVRGLDGKPYGPQHERAATRIQATWKGRKARQMYYSVRQAAAEEDDLELMLDEQEIQAFTRHVSRGRRSGRAQSSRAREGESGRSTEGPAGSSGGAGGAAEVAELGQQRAVAEGAVAPARAAGNVRGSRPGSLRGSQRGSEGGHSDQMAASVGGWSATSTALSTGLELALPPEAPPLYPPAARGLTGPGAPSFGRRGGDGAVFDPEASAGGFRSLERMMSSRRGPPVVPQVSLTPDGQIQGDVDDLDLLDLHEDDGSLPSGFFIEDGQEGGEGGSFRVQDHGSDGGDEESVF